MLLKIRIANNNNNNLAFVLSAYCCQMLCKMFICITSTTKGVDSVIIPILQLWKLKHSD